MKGERKKRRRRIPCLLLALIFISGIFAASPVYRVSATGTENKGSGSLTVAAPGTEETKEMAEDLKDANLVIDLYALTDMAGISGADGYAFRFREEYRDLEKRYTDLGQNPDNNQWREFLDEAARKIVLAVPSVTPDHTADFGEKLPLDAKDQGIYLLIPRESGSTSRDDYVTEVTDEDGKTWFATTADSKRYTYTFAPVMISVPCKEDNGQWNFNPKAVLKPEQAPIYGTLDIVKTLLSYAADTTATAIFEIAIDFNQKKTVRYISLVFDKGAETKHVLVEDIPIGADVTVTEIYSGASYKAVGSTSESFVMEADKTVAFTNEYDPDGSKGGSVTNHFTYHGPEAEGTVSSSNSGSSSFHAGWEWKPLTDNQTRDLD